MLKVEIRQTYPPFHHLLIEQEQCKR